MIKKVLLALTLIIILFFGGKYFYKIYMRGQCQAEMETNQQTIKELHDLGSLVISHVKFQNPELQTQQDIKEFVSNYVKVKQIFMEKNIALYESREDILYYLEILPVILNNEDYFLVKENSQRPSVSHEELVTQMKLRLEKLQPMPSCK